MPRPAKPTRKAVFSHDAALRGRLKADLGGQRVGFQEARQHRAVSSTMAGGAGGCRPPGRWRTAPKRDLRTSWTGCDRRVSTPSRRPSGPWRTKRRPSCRSEGIHPGARKREVANLDAQGVVVVHQGVELAAVAAIRNGENRDHGSRFPTSAQKRSCRPRTRSPSLCSAARVAWRCAWLG